MRILGIQIDGPYVRAALMEKDGKELKVRVLKCCSPSDPQNVKELYIPSFSGRIVSGVPSQKILIREIELNVPKSRHLDEALIFQSEANDHFKTEDVITIPYLIDQKGGKT